MPSRAGAAQRGPCRLRAASARVGCDPSRGSRTCDHAISRAPRVCASSPWPPAHADSFTLRIGLWRACFEPTKAVHFAFHYFAPFVAGDPMTQHEITWKTYREFPQRKPG